MIQICSTVLLCCICCSIMARLYFDYTTSSGEDVYYPFAMLHLLLSN